MAISSFPFDNGDTTESLYSKLFRELQDDGVAAGADQGSFLVTADGSGLDVQVATGFAVVRGHAIQSTAVETLVLDAANPQPRIDRVILRLDPAADSIVLTVLKGTPGATPLKPALQQSDTGIYEIALADIAVAADALNVSNANVTDTRRFVGSRTGVWTTTLRPATPRKGKCGFNTTTSSWEFWNGTEWTALGGKVTKRIPHTFTLSNEVKVASGSDYFIPPFYVPVPAGQTVTYAGCRYSLQAGGQVTVQPKRGATAMGTGRVATTTPVSSTSGAGAAFADGDALSITVSAPSGTPKNLTFTVYLDYTA